MTQTRVVLADDDVLLREGVASLLELSGFRVVGRAGDDVTADPGIGQDAAEHGGQADVGEPGVGTWL